MSESFNFGVELELMLRPKNIKKSYTMSTGDKETIQFDEDNDVWLEIEKKGRYHDKVKSVVIDLLNEAGIPTKDGHHMAPDLTFSNWNVQLDTSMTPPEGYAPIEIVSRKLALAANNEASSFEEVERVYPAVEKIFEIIVPRTTSTHIHVSVEGEPFHENLGMMKKIVKMVVLCDNSAIAKCVPAERNISEYCHETCSRVFHSMNPVPKDQTNTSFAELFKHIDTVFDTPILPWEIDRSLEKIGDQKNSSWHYGNVDGGKGTIEFRRPPGSPTASDAFHWISFCLSLIQGALLADDQIFARFANRTVGEGITVKEMVNNFLKPGADALGISQHLKPLPE